MIPPTITRSAIVEAAKIIDREGIPATRASRTVDVIVSGKPYPPKYLLSVAAERVGAELSAWRFITTEARHFLEKRGFQIVEKQAGEPPVSFKVEDEQALLLEWVDDESGGYTDYYPLSWFAKTGRRTGLIHLTVGPRGGISRAKCDMEVSATSAVLNYEPYMGEFNDEEDFYSGVEKLVFSDETRTRLLDHAFWKNPGESFSRCSIRTDTQASLRSRFSATCDLPTDEPTGVVTPIKRSGTRSFFVRNEKIRKAVLKRATGKCEFCGQPGFLTKSGMPYLETHHITALADEGEDTLNNVISLCANHHREAHFGAESDTLNGKMLEIVRAIRGAKARK